MVTALAMKRIQIRTCILMAASAALLAACAGDSSKYPSLAIRDAERQTGQFTPAAPEPVAPVASPQSLAGIVENARRLEREFLAAQPGARSLAASARGLGSESNLYSRAVVEIAALSSLRGQTAAALASLDILQAEAATTFAPVGGIISAQAEIKAILAQQDAALASIARDLGQ